MTLPVDLSRSMERIMRLTAEMIEESHTLKRRARETMSQSTVVIERSRKLLSLWPVSGTPALPKPEPREEVSAEAAVAPAEATKVPAATEPGLERVVERDFAGETVRLDGRHFVDCKVENCTLEYFGGPVILEGTQFLGCGFRFGGEAAMTVSVLECFGLIPEQDRTARAPRVVNGTGRVN